jgi:branched-subunit amino acid aminotransferase/4-amino-4-deoxychorismate lyase
MIDRSIAMPWVWLNGKLTRAGDATVSVFDRGFTLGDGVFDTLRILNRCPLQWRAHWRRFCSTAKRLGFNNLPQENECLGAFKELLRKNKCADAVARMQLTRGAGPRGYSPAPASSPTFVISLHAAPTITAGRPQLWKLGVASLPFPNSHLLSGNKTASRVYNVIAKMEADRAGFDDALFLNGDGLVTEAISSNMFWIIGGVLFTPPLDLGILPGTTRGQILKLCRRGSLKCVEKSASLKEIVKADAVFLSVSTAGIIEVVQIGKTKLRRNPVVAELHGKLEESHQRESRCFQLR